MNERPDEAGSFPRPGEPTEAPPGSELKIRILVERAARREPLFHPQDGPRRYFRSRVPVPVILPAPVEVGVLS
jgi:hypothetical protein